MGSGIPPPLEFNKYYCITVRWYQSPEGGCKGVPNGIEKCCRPGWMIFEWGEYDLECQNYWELCIWTGYSAQMLLNVEGPYDDEFICQEYCEE